MEHYGNPFFSCWQKDRKIFVSPQIKALHSQCNTLRGLKHPKQSYFKDNQIYTIFGPHED